MTPHVVEAAGVAPQPWRNGGGLTRELLLWPQGAGDDWQLRITLAEVRRDGPFSAFPGVQRHFAVVGGGGLQLRWPQDDRWRDLQPGHTPLSFDGAHAPDCRLSPRPSPLSPDHSVDLNLMTRGGWQGHMRAMRLQGAAASLTWTAAAHRGFFSRVPGRWRCGDAPPRAVAAQTLLWQALEGAEPSPAPAEDWHFLPDTPPADGAPLGWWLVALPLAQD